MLRSQSTTSLGASRTTTINAIGTENSEQNSLSSKIQSVNNISLAEMSLLPHFPEVIITSVNDSLSRMMSLPIGEPGDYNPKTNSSYHCENSNDTSNNGMIKVSKDIMISNERKISREETIPDIKLFSLPERSLSNETETRPTKSLRSGLFTRSVSHVTTIHPNAPQSRNSKFLIRRNRASSPKNKDKEHQPRSELPGTFNSPIMSQQQIYSISGPQPERVLSNETETHPVKSSRPGLVKRFLSHIATIHSDAPSSDNPESLARTKRDSSPENKNNESPSGSKSPGTFNSPIMSRQQIYSISGPQPERVLSNETETHPVKSSRPGLVKRFLSYIATIHSDAPSSDNPESLARTKRDSSPENKNNESPSGSKSPGTPKSPIIPWWQPAPIFTPPVRVLSMETDVRPVKSSRPGLIRRFLSHITTNHSGTPLSDDAVSLARAKRVNSLEKEDIKSHPEPKSPGARNLSVMAWLRPTSISRPQTEQVSSKELIPILKNVSITVANVKYSGPQSIFESQWFKHLSSEFDQKKLSELLSSYSNNESFLSIEHLRDIVNHDIDFLSDELIAEKLVQNKFLTKNGWADKLKQYDTINKTKFYAGTQMGTFWKNYKFSPLKEPHKYVDIALKKLTSTDQINLYRTMPFKEAEDIILNRNFDSLGGHLGDFREALSYLHRGTGGKVTLEIPLKPGAHELLFSPAFSAIQGAGKTTSVIAKLAELNKHGFFPKGSKNEGYAAGYIGIKSEATGESGLSISISDKQSRKLFEKFVDIPEIRVVSFRD